MHKLMACTGEQRRFVDRSFGRATFVSVTRDEMDDLSQKSG